MSFRVEHEDDHAFHVRHPNGQVFQIAKAGLDKSVMKKIQAMKPVKMADGGEVPGVDLNADSSSMPAPQDPGDQIAEEANNAPVRPEYQKLLEMEKASSDPQKDAVYGPPETRALQKLQAMDAALSNPDSVSNASLAAAKALQSKVSGPGPSPAGAPSAPGADPALPPQVQLASTAPAEIQKNGGADPANASQGQGDDPYGMAGDFIHQEMRGIQGLANAKAQQSKDIEKAYGDYMKNAPQMGDMAKQAEAHRQEMEKINQENDQLGQEIRQGKVDPQHFWASKSTGSKISTGIGLILGGIGAGMTGQPNAALQLVQKQMDQDLQAQRENLDNKRSLLSMNMQRYGHLQSAMAATQLQMNQALQNQIGLAAAKSGSKEAMANAQLAIGQLKERAMPLVQSLAMMRIQGQSLGAGGGQGGLPEGKEPLALLADPKYQEKRVVVNGRAYQARDKEAATESAMAESKIGPVKNLVDQLGQLGPKALMPGTEENNRAQAIRASLAMTIPQMKGIKRLSEKEIEMAESMVKDPTKFSQLVNGGAKNKQFLKGAFDEIESLRRSNLIGYKGMASLNTRKPGWN